MNNLELEITAKAYNDMESISDFIAKDNKTAANRMVKLFYRAFKTLLNHPNIGKVRRDLTPFDVKFYIVKKNYLVVYGIINSKKLRIYRVLTTYQDICAEI